MPAEAMPCVICKSPTRLQKGGGTYSAKAGAHKRYRECTADPTHVFETREQPASQAYLKVAEVITALDTEPRPYESARLSSDLEYVLGAVLPPASRRYLVYEAENLLLRHMWPAAVRDESLPSGVSARLTADQISEAIIDVLRREANDSGNGEPKRRTFRRAHMMFAMARGNQGSAMRDASEVLAWLDQEYGARVEPLRLGHRLERHYDRPRIDRWHPLRNDAAPEPTHVVFLVHTESVSDDGTRRPMMEHRRVPYQRARLERSIRHSLAGTDDHTRVARFVLQWVLWSLGGQSVVRSADLASQITQCLRRVNEVAYLRWCILVKDLDVEDVWAEATGLREWPSPRLEYDPDAAWDPRRAAHAMITPIPDVVDALQPWGADGDPSSDSNET